MAEEVTQATQTTPETPAQVEPTILEKEPPAPESPAIINADGTFVEGWQEKFLPEELRTEECFKLVKDFPEMARQFVHQRKAIGMSKVVIPTDKSTPAEWDTFWTAAGRPKSPDDYKADIPQDMAELFPKERLDAARKLAHSIGISGKQFAEYMKFEVEQAQRLLEDETKREAQAAIDTEAALRKELGAAYDERIHAAKRTVAEVFGANQERHMKFLQRYGNDPEIIHFASTIGVRLAESQAKVAEFTQNTPAAAQSQIKELLATPGYTDLDEHRMTNDQRAAITAQLRELHKQANPAKK